MGRIGQSLSKEHRQKISETAKKNRPKQATTCGHKHKRAVHSNGMCSNCYSRLKKYGITEVDYQTLLAKQNGGCAICGSSGERRRLDVDHCHITDKIRGLLCNNCNRGLGHLKDDPALLRLAATYLER